MKKLFMRRWIIFVYRDTSFLIGVLLPLSLLGPMLVLSDALVCLPIMLVLSLSSVWLCTVIAEKKNAKHSELLLEELEPKQFLDGFLKAVESRNPKNWNTYTRSMVVNAYIAIGNYKEAETILIDHINSVPKNSGNMGKLINRADSLLRLVVLYSAERPEASKRAWDEAQSIMASVPFPAEYKAVFDGAYYSMRLYDGYAADTVDYYKSLAENAPVKLAKVNAYLRLAEAYRLCGETETAKEYYSYVAENGKNLSFAEKAKEYLRTL